MDLAFTGITVGVFIACVLGFFGVIGLIKAFYVKVPQGTALIINDLSSTPKVKFTGGIVFPVVYKKEFMRISLITLEVDRRGSDGLICKDNMRADITVAFYLRVNETPQDVLKVAKSLGAERASDRQAVSELFNAKFSEALKTVGKQIDFVKLFEDRIFFREKIVEVIGNDLNGYILEDVAIDYLEQTPKKSLDPTNILDAEGIKKITQLTATQNVFTNELERDEEKAIKKKDVETREAILALERQQADAEARQDREIANIQAREEAETLKVKEEEHLKAETARIETERDIQVQEENKQREIEVAEQNRQRAVVIEVEKVTRAQDLEVVSREREVELETIEKEKAVEVEKKAIANIIRERVAVDKTVAQEEERIKEVRVVSEADRQKQVVVMDAQAKAEEELVMQVKQAEAEEIMSKHKAVEINNLAQADLEAAAKKADSMKKLAEGVKAERSAPGFAEAQVQEAKAVSLEKEGLAEAKVLAEKMSAQAEGDEKIGLAKAVTDREQGIAIATANREQGLAKAETDREQGIAVATANREQGIADAEVIRQKFMAEAEGLIEKFKAMDTMTVDSRSHEEFRMQLEKDFDEVMATISANKDIAKEQADVLAAALKEANIDIVGGQGDFFDSFAKSLTVGKAVNGVVGKSPVVAAAFNKLMSIGGGDEFDFDEVQGKREKPEALDS